MAESGGTSCGRTEAFSPRSSCQAGVSQDLHVAVPEDVVPSSLNAKAEGALTGDEVLTYAVSPCCS